LDTATDTETLQFTEIQRSFCSPGSRMGKVGWHEQPRVGDFAIFEGVVAPVIVAIYFKQQFSAELFYFAPTLLLRGGGYLKGFSPDQLNALALLSLKLFGLGAASFTVFYATGWVLRGYLIF
jgi:hypothetical protein